MFLTVHRDTYTGLPKPSYNLWEEKFGVHTYTAATVYAGLKVAARFSEICFRRARAVISGRAAVEKNR